MVDGNGTFSSNVTPGTYYILIKSNNRTAMNVNEIYGMVNIKKIQIKSGEIKNVNKKFEMH